MSADDISPFDRLPPEIHALILTFVAGARLRLLPLRLVSKWWCAVFNEHLVQRRVLYVRYIGHAFVLVRRIPRARLSVEVTPTNKVSVSADFLPFLTCLPISPLYFCLFHK